MAAERSKDFWKLEFAVEIVSTMAGGAFAWNLDTTAESSVASAIFACVWDIFVL